MDAPVHYKIDKEVAVSHSAAFSSCNSRLADVSSLINMNILVPFKPRNLIQLHNLPLLICHY